MLVRLGKDAWLRYVLAPRSRTGESQHAMRKLLFALATIALASKPTAAADVSFEDILGSWCQNDGANIVFSQNQANVTLANGTTRTLKISKVDVIDNYVRVTLGPPST